MTVRRISVKGFRFAVAAAACAALAVPAVVHVVSTSTVSTSPSPDKQQTPEPTPQEKSLLYTAGQLLLRDCMGKRGFEYFPVKENPVPEAREFRYVLTDLTWAQKHGYGSDIQRELAKVRETDPNQRYFHSLPAKRRAVALTAVNGSDPLSVTAKAPDGVVLRRSAQGCQSEVYRTLYGDLEAWFQATVTDDALAELRYSRVTADPRFAEAVKPWSTCMRTAGHPYASPTKLREALRPSQRPLPREEEIEIAVAEARCANDSGLARTTRALDRQYAQNLLKQYHSAVDTRRRLQLAALQRARSIVGISATESRLQPQREEKHEK
ncbi:hypothetical protein [Streptomyces sp. NPDC060205]|uniref:hypothetical protein n=1 Tax=Streptomyces sp. NPDC060205 TaxID=3347072 RepID=UPI003664430D